MQLVLSWDIQGICVHSHSEHGVPRLQHVSCWKVQEGRLHPHERHCVCNLHRVPCQPLRDEPVHQHVGQGVCALLRAVRGGDVSFVFVQLCVRQGVQSVFWSMSLLDV